nr:ribonuclease H-like domain, reverse transcriptase, RNA-dependent DNA polymerase [Tanacetum cinerariifolium]
MGDENPIYTLGDYSKPSHEGYMNTIELPVGNHVVPLRSNTIRLVQNGCLFHRIQPRSITTWEDLTTCFIAQFFPSGRTVKHLNDILMFQQHHGESLSEAWTRFKDLLPKFPHHGIDRLLKKVLIREAVNSLVTKNINSISLTKGEEEREDNNDIVTGDEIKKAKETKKEVAVKEAKNKPIKKAEKEEAVEAPSSQHVKYYLKHKINEKLIEGIVDNHRLYLTRRSLEDIRMFSLDDSWRMI